MSPIKVINVFLDTNIFDSLHYDFTGTRLQTLNRLISDGLVSLYLSDVVIGEVKQHLKRNLTDSLNAIKAPFKKKLSTIDKAGYETDFKGDEALKVLSHSDDFSFIFRLKEEDLLESMIKEALSLFDSFIENTGSTIVSSKGIDVSDILVDYFAPNPPFENRKEKKEEFPDAIMIARIKQFAKEKGNVCIVSEDKSAFAHLSNISGIKYFHDLHSFLLSVKTYDDWFNIVESFLSVHKRDVNQIIIDEIEEMNPHIEGRTFGRKGDHDGIEYDGTIIDEIRNISYKLTSVDMVNDDSITITLSCTATIDAHCTYFDEGNSAWDSEEKDYIFRVFGAVEEIHIANFQAVATLARNNDTIANIHRITFDLTLDQETRQSHTHLSVDEWAALDAAKRHKARLESEADGLDTLDEYNKH